MRRGLPIFCRLWAVVGTVLFSLGFGSVNDDARAFVSVAAALGVASALAAAWLVTRRRSRWAGALLAVSAIIPT